MATKVCTKCKTEKDLLEFYNDKKSPDGHSCWCIECDKKKHKEYYQAHSDKIREKTANYYRNNIEKVKSRTKEYVKRPEVKARIKAYREANKEHRREVKRAWTSANREHVNEEARKFYHAHKDSIRPKYQEYKKSHREQINAQAKEYREKNKYNLNKKVVERLHNDPIFKLKCQIRGMVRDSFGRKNWRKASRTKDIVGCDLDFLYEYLCKTWKDRYGEDWNGQPCHIDHIIPLAMAKTKEDVIRLCHYTNLQLLTPEDNMRKSDRLPTEAPPHLLTLL